MDFFGGTDTETHPLGVKASPRKLDDPFNRTSASMSWRDTLLKLKAGFIQISGQTLSSGFPSCFGFQKSQKTIKEKNSTPSF